jgi:hypothetical protein
VKALWKYITSLFIGFLGIVFAFGVLVGIPLGLGEMFGSALIAEVSFALVWIVACHALGEWLREQEW